VKSTKVEPITVPKLTNSAAPIQRAAPAPKTSFAQALQNKVEQIANPQGQASSQQDAARMEEAKKQFGMVLMRGILAAPKPKKLEKVESEGGLSDSD